jgi:antitoxin ParD1/3/4
MAIARAKGKLRGKQPKLSEKQQKELCKMHGTGKYSISDLAELFSISRPTVYPIGLSLAPRGDPPISAEEIPPFISESHRRRGGRIAIKASCAILGRNCSYHSQGRPMSTVEKISIALPPEMVAVVRSAVDTGEYASSSEVVRDALRDWTQKRSLRQQGVEELRQVWQQAIKDKTPGAPVDDVLNRLERKYQAMADAQGKAR